ncbi:hypothetical protein Lrub_0084 [Legionella rubrilucens]|uniref:Membrane-associated HD superfamily hydrolase n=1 Tax=Legionella rubrilucens TaxID=458 RepID=A0A0W0Y750_9GAMM|nr:hypothetical protein [Legionella rubrilucens]KTD52452.1 hypothetical protein Lrub_0084 [Legionella rubrilucens]
MKTREELAREANAKKALEDERDRSIRQALTDEETKKQAQLKSEVDVLRKEERDNEAIEKWARVEKMADDLLSRGMEGYNEWITIMMNIFNAYQALHAALCVTFDNRPIEPLLKGLWDSKLGFASLVKLMDEKGLHLGDKIGDKLREKGWKKDDLLPLKVNIDFTDKGGTTLSVTYDGKPLPDEQQEVFKTGFLAWAKTRGYAMDNSQNPPVLKDRTSKQPMTKDAFIQLNADDQNSLQSFFSHRYHMDAEMDKVTSSSLAP